MTKHILQVVGGMNRGGVETWLMHVLRHIDREQFQMDFLVHTTEPCAYDDEIRALGSRIIPCLHPSKPLTYARNFKQILHEYGQYDIVHSHVHHFSGYVLRLAAQAGVPMRIAHSHNDTSVLRASARLPRRAYLSLTEHWIRRYATHGLAASERAAVALFGSNWQSDHRYRVLYCGIDLAPFHTPVDRAAVRAELGIPKDAFVIGHVGRFHEQKNHMFLVDIAAEVVKREPKACFLLVGDGPLRSRIEQKVEQLGLARHFVFAGLRSDVPRVMKGAMDVFLFPSLYEGLGLVLIEAQAGELQCVVSNVVPEEADIVPGLVERLSVKQSPSMWATAVVTALTRYVQLEQPEAWAIACDTKFNIHHGISEIISLYGCEYTV